MSAGGFSLNVASVGGVVTGAHVLRGIHVGNANAAVRYLLLWDQVGAAATGETSPLYQFTIPAAGQFVIDDGFFGPSGLAFTSGIAWGVSTVRGTKDALATAADHDVALAFV